jgi:hypothetical protein
VLSTKVIKRLRNYKRSRYCYYRVSRNRWHKAVSSHSPYGSRNPDALSRYIPDEDILHHKERKSFLLPCGWTLAQSWAALRKAWLGFKIALSNGDMVLMTHYASFITRVQTEMGIRVTDFDSDILDEQNDDEISRNCFYKKQPETKVRLEEKSVDYDSVMEKARDSANTNHFNIVPPRQGIFDRSKNSCWYPPQEKKKPRNSCWYPPQEKKDYYQQKIVSRIRTTDESCVWSPDKTFMPNREEKGRIEVQSQEELDRWNANEAFEDGVDPCSCKVPNESQSQDEDENWEAEDNEMDDKEVVVGFDPCYYQVDFRDDISTKDGEEGRESSKLRSCFYKSN